MMIIIIISSFFRPSIEEVKSWSESFDKLMMSPGKCQRMVLFHCLISSGKQKLVSSKYSICFFFARMTTTIDHPSFGNESFIFFFFLAGRHYFREFLRSEYSEENFLFWMSCESLKNEQNPDIIEEKARLIYEDYISILSPKEVTIIGRNDSFSNFSLQVSLDSRVREVINKNMVEPSPHTFDEAQLQIYTLMHRDSYPRFINSQLYRRLLRNESEKT